LGEVVKLCLSDTLFSANGRVDVDSKGTANHHGDLELRELFQAHRNGARGSGVKIHAHNIPQEFGIASADPQAERYVTDTAFCEPKDDARQHTSFVVLNTLGANHSCLLVRFASFTGGWHKSQRYRKTNFVMIGRGDALFVASCRLSQTVERCVGVEASASAASEGRPYKGNLKMAA
jgi:hypothetical protein